MAEGGWIIRFRGTVGGTVRIRFIVLVTAVAAFWTRPAAGAEHIAMPFACHVDRGRVVLMPSPERHYAILGLRSQRPYTWCLPGDGPCRIRMLHRFDISCGGTRVPWLSVAAAARRTGGRETSIENGRMRVALMPRGALLGEECADPPSLADRGLKRQVVAGSFERPCWPRLGGRTSAAFAHLPPGFAPLNEAGARIVMGQPVQPAASASVASAVASAPGPALAAVKPQETVRVAEALTNTNSAADSTGNASGLPAVRPIAPPARQALNDFDALATARQMALRAGGETASDSTVPSSWRVTVVEHAETVAAEAPEGTPHALAGRVVLLLVFGTVLVGVGWQRVQTARGGSGVGLVGLGRALTRRAGGELAMDPQERACLELGHTVEQLMRNADASLAELKSAAPLRGVLRQELDLIRQRLAESLKTADQAKPNWRQLKARLQTAIRELHRIVKIADGAVASFSETPQRTQLPASREEAYDVLGVNAEVSETVLKKVVDALRMSWHPDLARGEEDRARREERTKIINVAWDLITGRRAEA